MSFDVGAGRHLIRDATTAIENGPVELEDMLPVVTALSDALDEITRLTSILHGIHLAMHCPMVRKHELAAPPEPLDGLGRTKPAWCET